MITGVGTDIVAVGRLDAFWSRHGQRGAERILAAVEISDCVASAHPGRFLAKRFAAKEALAKALGTGLRSPLLMTNIALQHDALGKPCFALLGEAQQLLPDANWQAHVSISDERDYAVAFVVIERRI